MAYPDRADDVTDLVGRDTFLDALEDEDLRVRILDRDPADLDAALKHAIKLESYTGGRGMAGPGRPGLDRQPRQKERFRQVVTEQDHYLPSTPSGTQPVGISEDSLIRCFKEGMRSYMSENSPQEYRPMKGLGRKPDDRDAGRPRGGGRKYMDTSSTPSYGDQGTAARNHGGRPAPGSQGKSRGNKSASFRSPMNQGWKEGVCHNCGEPGHWHRECQQPRRESRSPQSGGGGQPPREPRVQLIDDKTRKKTTYLTVYWRGRQYNALLDSGCEVSVVGRRLLPKNVELSPPETDLFAANRTKIPLIGRMTMDFTVAGKSYSAKLAVTNQVDELILGIDWLQETAAMWDFGTGKILLGGKWIWLQQRVTEDRVRRVYAAESMEIPLMSEANIPVTVTWPTLHPTRSDWLVEPKVVNEGLVVARTLVSGEAPSSVVRVINVSSQPCNIEYDAELGLASQVSVALKSDELADAEPRINCSPRWMSISTQLDTSHVDCVVSQLKDNLLRSRRQPWENLSGRMQMSLAHQSLISDILICWSTVSNWIRPNQCARHSEDIL